MAVRQYIKFDGVEGESRSRDHKGEIDVFSFGADRARGGEGSGADIGNWE